MSSQEVVFISYLKENESIYVMCGICGFNWSDKALVHAMSKKLEHRGPDGEGFLVDKEVSLGHRRLSIIDLDKRGNNPIFNEEGDVCVIFNGEIYNYKELRKELEKLGHQFSTQTDTEVLVHLYEQYGTGFLNRLNGMFAFCLYDMTQKKLFIARDRIGIKPLYFYNDGDQFAFASEINALLELSIPRSVDEKAFQTYLFLRFTLQDTLLKGVKKLSPGSFLIYDLKTKKHSIDSYWDLTKFRSPHSIDYLQKQLSTLMNDSVRLRLQADVPVGVYLSGGIDSSIITGLTTKYNDEVNTFSVGFENSTNELSYAKIASEHFSTNHQEIMITNDHIDELDKVVFHMDEPISDAAFLPVYFLSKETKSKATVALAGEGADEIFTGYDRYKLLYFSHKYRKLLPGVVPSWSHDILKRAIKIKQKKNLLAKHLEGIRMFDDQEFADLEVETPKDTFHSKGKSILDTAQYFDLKTLLPNDFCMKADKMSAAHAVEERVPFLDHRVVELGFKIPENYRLRGFNEKFILKKTFKDMLPKQIVKRKKHGFQTPADVWFKGVLKEKLDHLLDESSHQLYNKEYAKKLLESFQQSGKNHKLNFYTYQKLWAILMFEMWHKKVVAS